MSVDAGGGGGGGGAKGGTDNVHRNVTFFFDGFPKSAAKRTFNTLNGPGNRAIPVRGLLNERGIGGNCATPP